MRFEVISAAINALALATYQKVKRFGAGDSPCKLFRGLVISNRFKSNRFRRLAIGMAKFFSVQRAGPIHARGTRVCYQGKNDHSNGGERDAK